jgi:hypothetical protein
MTSLFRTATLHNNDFVNRMKPTKLTIVILPFQNLKLTLVDFPPSLFISYISS